MQLALLHLDEALKAQPDFIKACEALGARQIELEQEAAHLRLWAKQPQLGKFIKLLAAWMNDLERPLIFMGSGDFHHVTSLLLDLALEKTPEPVTVIHFDNHPDWVKFSDGLHCGSWINHALSNPKVEKLITVGVSSSDLKNPDWKGAHLDLLTQGKLELYPYAHSPSRVRKNYGEGPSHCQKDNYITWAEIEKIGETDFLKKLLSRITTTQVYITIDKDVLRPQDAATNWDQGGMSLPFLLDMITSIGRQHHIVAADVTGDYSVPCYRGSFLTKLLKRAEILIDQPWQKTDPTIIQATNTVTNQVLLKTLSAVMT